MDVFLANEQDIAVDEADLSALASHALEMEEVEEGAELSVLFVTDDHIRRLNARFAGDNYATDVLAFPMMEEDDDALVLGDVVICPVVALQNATRAGRTLHDELKTLLVHGTLHLLGYDHKQEDEKAKMDERLKQVLDSF